MRNLEAEVWVGILAIVAGISLPLAVQAAPEDGSPRHEMMARIDTDRDGKISPAEWNAATDARFARTDTNGDGFISPDEMKTAAQKRAAEHAARRKDRSEEMFKRADANGDGKLSKAEYEARSQKMYERMMSHKGPGPDAPPVEPE